MFLPGVFLLLGGEELQVETESSACFLGFQQVVHVPPRGCWEGVCKQVHVFVLMLGNLILVPPFVYDLHGSLRTEDRNFGSRPGIVDVPPHVLGVHDTVGPAVGLPGYYRNLGYGCFRISKDQLCSVPYDAVVLLVGACSKEAYMMACRFGMKELKPEKKWVNRDLAKSPGHPRRWWWGCWTRRRTWRNEPPSLKRQCRGSLKSTTKFIIA